MARAGLTARRVVAEAAVLVDEVGFDRLTLSTVAQRLGVTLPSLYKHVDGLDGLRRELSLLAARDLAAALSTAAVGRAGRDALHAIARAYREYAKSHPGLSAADVRAPAPEDSEHIAVSEAILAILMAVLAGYGIVGDDAVDAIRSLRAVLHGFVTLELAGGFGMPRSVDESYVRLIDALDTAFAGWAAISVAGSGTHNSYTRRLT